MNLLAVCYAVIFGVVCLACLSEVYKSYLFQKRDALRGSETTGWRYRSYLHLCLAMGSVGQAIAFAFQVSKLNTGTWTHPVGIWYVTIMTAPSLLFLSAFSIVLQFWVNLYYAHHEDWLPIIKQTLVAYNTAVYVCYFALLLASILKNDPFFFEQTSSILIACCQLALAGACASYGFQLYAKIRPEHAYLPDSSSRTSIARKMILLCLIIIQALVARSIFAILVAVHMIRIADDDMVTKIRIAAVSSALCELAPSIAILISTRIKNVREYERSQSEDLGLLETDNSAYEATQETSVKETARPEPFLIYHQDEKDETGGRYHTFKEFRDAHETQR